MVSSLWSQAARTCVSTPKATQSFSIFTRSFILPSRSSVPMLPRHVRTDSSLATAQQVGSKPTLAPLPETPDHLSFSPLRNVMSPGTFKAITVKPFAYKTMSAVQAEVLPLLPEIAEPYNKDAPADAPPRDLLVKAKTGTGKTMAFLVPAIEARLKAIEAHGKSVVHDAGLTSDKSLEERARRVFAREQVGTLIISPTRELATQIANEALKLSQTIMGLRDIVVSTPGRLRDLLDSEPEVPAEFQKRKSYLILDEADTLLDMGFRDDIERSRNFAAPTVSRAIQQVARSTLAPNHRFINCVTEDTSPVHAHVEQYHTLLPNAGHQIPHVLRLLAHDQLANPDLYASLLRELSPSSLPAGRNTHVYEIHSKKDQNSRTNTSDSFRKDFSGASVLVTSDVSARGVDYPGVTRVIQVGIPANPEQYVHRVGRTGRAGTQGRGDLILNSWEMGFVTWQLTNLSAQLTSCKDFDANPTEFFSKSGPLPQVQNQRGRPVVVGPNMFKGPISAVIGDIERNIGDVLQKVDEDTINETFTSLLGFYIAKTPELRVQKGVVVEGCKPGQSRLLHRLGASDGRTKKFGQRRAGGDRGFGARQPRESAWSGRGQQRDRTSRDADRPRSRPGWMDRHDGGQAEAGGSEPRTSSYGRERSSFSRRGGDYEKRESSSWGGR
ncbi:P-loop containing nucleoside triphosphate hydrolase protein, partial [Infundibulicybe gibba]